MNYFKFLTVILSLVWFSLGRAELEETNKRFPLQIDANSIQHDDLNSVTKFIGNVVLVRGSLILKGDELTLKQNEAGMSYCEIVGSPAIFKTRRKSDGEWIEGQAIKLDYDEKDALFLLKGQAKLVRWKNGQIKEQVSGDELSYNNSSEIYKAKTQPGELRTRMTVMPRNSAD